MLDGEHAEGTEAQKPVSNQTEPNFLHIHPSEVREWDFLFPSTLWVH